MLNLFFFEGGTELSQLFGLWSVLKIVYELIDHSNAPVLSEMPSLQKITSGRHALSRVATRVRDL